MFIAQVRNVKWLQRITVADDESDGHWQRYDYKVCNKMVSQEHFHNLHNLCLINIRPSTPP